MKRALGVQVAAVSALVLLMAGCGTASPSASTAPPVSVAPGASGVAVSPSLTAAAATPPATPPATPAPATPPPASAASPAQSVSAGASPRALCQGPRGCALDAGRYVWQRVQPPVAFSVDSGWTVDYESASGFDMIRTDTPRSTLTVALLDQVFATPCATAPTRVSTRATDIAAWLRADSGLSITSERSTSIGGRPVLVFDVSAGPLCPGGAAVDLPLFELNGELFALDPGDLAEITVLEFDGRAVTVVAAGAGPTFAAFRDRTRLVVASLSDR